MTDDHLTANEDPPQLFAQRLGQVPVQVCLFGNSHTFFESGVNISAAKMNMIFWRSPMPSFARSFAVDVLTEWDAKSPSHRLRTLFDRWCLPGEKAAGKALLRLGLRDGYLNFLQFLVFRPAFGATAEVNTPEFWFAMQAAMIAGFCTAYPVNWLLIRGGVKEEM